MGLARKELTAVRVIAAAGTSDPMRNARHIMTSYRRFILGTKRKWNLQMVSNGRLPAKRIARSLLLHRNYSDAYLKAKRAVLAGQEFADA